MADYVRPYTMRLDSTGTYHVVLDAAGRLVAQGSVDLAAAVMAGTLSTVQMQGTLWELDNAQS